MKTITHDVKTISNDYFTITHDLTTNVFHIDDQYGIADRHTLTAEKFLLVFKNDPKITKLFFGN